jgi:hypothetical protein
VLNFLPDPAAAVDAMRRLRPTVSWPPMCGTTPVAWS